MTNDKLTFVFALLLAGCSATPSSPANDQAEVVAVSEKHIPVTAPNVSHGTGQVVALIEHVADGSGGLTRLSPDYIYERLRGREDSEKISAAFDRLQIGETTAAREALIHALELDFIHNPTTSSLDLLNPELSAHFREFEWHEDDYPGGPEGPNEQLADILSDALDIVSPERRANRSRTAVMTREEVTPDLLSYVLAQWVDVPGESDWKLNRYAMASYVQMRQAADEDGVELKILSGHRDPERARQNAARVGNRFAVASFSSHSLGLAVDFALPRSASEDVYKLSTRPMEDVVAMRSSPVHKWLHLYGHEFGWYPFQHEPWHWEFNPAGFREVFFADFVDGAPLRNP